MTFKELDIRTIQLREKHPTIFAEFENLNKDETFQLINDHDPKPLYSQFNAEMPNQSGWECVEKGPEVWRVNIFKL